MDDPADIKSTADEIRRMLAEADADVRRVIEEVTKIERATIRQKHRNKSALSRQIADAIRRGVK